MSGGCAIRERGVAALPTILVVTGVIAEIAIAGAFLAFIFIRSGLAARLTAEATAASRAGVQDALLQLVRDKNLNTSYTLTVGSYSTAVTVTKDNDCAITSTGRTCIVSIATALTRQKKFQAVTSVDAVTGEVRIISFSEVAI